MTDEKDRTLEEDRAAVARTLHRLVVLTVGVYLALVVFGAAAAFYGAYQREEIATLAESTNVSLCALRSDLIARTAAASDFLVKHPDGIPGVSAQVIQVSIDSQSRTIAALSTLDCPLE